MKIISHRGNIKGPIKDRENRPSYIDAAIKLGLDVEVDLRYISNEFWLGHDEAEYKVDLNWIEKRKNNIWFHCKNIEAVLELCKYNNFKYFCHSQDPYVVTSTNHIWCHNLNNSINQKCIIPLITIEDIKNYKYSIPYAICTDYVNNLFDKE